MSRETRTQHLTDAEFSLMLDGAQPGASAAAHLAGCTFCREELDAVQGSLGSFQALSTVWAEREAPRRVPVPSRWNTRLYLQPSWGAGLATAALTVSLAVWLALPGQHSAPANTPVLHPVHGDLTADNHLLSSIDQALSDQGQSVTAAAELRSEEHPDLHSDLGSLSD